MTHAFQMQTQVLVDRAKKRESAAGKKGKEDNSGDIKIISETYKAGSTFTV